MSIFDLTIDQNRFHFSAIETCTKSDTLRFLLRRIIKKMSRFYEIRALVQVGSHVILWNYKLHLVFSNLLIFSLLLSEYCWGYKSASERKHEKPLRWTKAKGSLSDLRQKIWYPFRRTREKMNKRHELALLGWLGLMLVKKLDISNIPRNFRSSSANKIFP